MEKPPLTLISPAGGLKFDLKIRKGGGKKKLLKTNEKKKKKEKN